VESLALGQGVRFDMDLASAGRETTGWVAPDDALLVWDRDSDGQITSKRELFGDDASAGHANGFERLAASFDANRDGVIDAADRAPDGRSALDTLHTWQDRNSDARVDAGEMRTLRDAGVVSLNLAYADLTDAPIDSNGNTIRQVGSFEKLASDGATRLTQEMSDVWFKVRSDSAIALPVEPETPTLVI
jgi:hypothetical protein